jgi:putative ABC transport system ATP-binding protein
MSSDVRISRLEMRFQVGASTVHALDGLDLKVPSGQFLMVHGASGSGKTSLLHLIAGLEKPTGGEIWIGDTEITALPANDADRFRLENIGVVFQFFNLIPSLTVEQNVALPLLLAGIRLPKLRPRIDELLDALEMGHRREHSPSELSGGQLQRVAIARALIVEPRVILADEPSGNLDNKASHSIFQLLREQALLRGVTTIVMTHDLVVTSYADRVVELLDGKLIRDSGEIPEVDDGADVV